MGQKERNLTNKRLGSMGENERLFRINAGTGWVGEMHVGTREKTIILKNPRPLQAAPRGWSDLVGWTSVVVTPDMVGKKVAIFTADEVKATGDLSPDQRRFGDLVKRMGGIFRVLRSPKDFP